MYCYTYAYLREDNTPYYIGKGRGRRYKQPHKGIPVPPIERILFLKTGLTEEEAYKHEEYLVAIIGRKNNGTGILRNLVEGGGRNNGYVWTDEDRERNSRIHKGRPKSQKWIDATAEARRNSTYCYSDEWKKKISQTNIESGILPPNRKGARWYNNGVKSTLTHSPPNGWQLGRL